MKYLFITYLIFLSSCGSQYVDPQPEARNTAEEEAAVAELQGQYLALLGTVTELSSIVLSDFATCSGTGDASDALINKICQVAQASTVEARIEMKAEIATAVQASQDQLDYLKDDINSILDELDDTEVDISDIQSDITTVQTDIATLQTDLTALTVRVTALEGQVTDITEGVCYRSRTSASTALTGAEVTFAWDSSIRMNSNYCTYNVPTAEYTIQKAGWYEIVYKINVQHTNSTTRQSIRSWILLNNTTQLDLSRTHVYLRQNTQGEFGTMTLSLLYELAVNDIIEIQNDAAAGNSAFGAGNASYNLLGTESFFMVKYVDDN